MLWLWIGIPILLLLLILLFSLYAYRRAFYAPAQNPTDWSLSLPEGERYAQELARTQELMREMEELPYEVVSVRAQDGKRLFARYYHQRDGAPLQIQFHGYRGSAVRDFCGGNRLARDLGFNTLVVDHRAHGKSEGVSITFGVKERLDCHTWAQYAQERFGADTKIVLCGVSMGAATVLMASELDLPQGVVGIIADCPYSSPVEIIAKVCAEMKFPPRLTMPFLHLGARLFGAFRLGASSAERAVKAARVPILLLHGMEDGFVPYEMSQRIFDACASEKYIELFPCADHGACYLVDRPRYERVVTEFTHKLLKK